MEVVERVYVLIRQAIFAISGFMRLVRESLWRRIFIYQMKMAIGSVPNVPYRVLMTLFFDEDLPLNGLNSSSSVTSDVNQSLISNVSADEFCHLFTSLCEQRQSHPEVILAHLNVNGLLPKFDWISLLLRLHLADFVFPKRRLTNPSWMLHFVSQVMSYPGMTEIVMVVGSACIFQVACRVKNFCSIVYSSGEFTCFVNFCLVFHLWLELCTVHLLEILYLPLLRLLRYVWTTFIVKFRFLMLLFWAI